MDRLLLGKIVARFARYALVVLFLVCVAVQPAQSSSLVPDTQRHVPLYMQRQSPTDLEITGLIEGLPPGAVGYVRYTDIASLAKVTVDVHNDDNFRERRGARVMVTGVPLATLAHALRALPNADMVDALCTDGYEGHFPQNYVVAHQPVLGLKINHEAAVVWASKTHEYDPGPYFVTQAHFKPSFRVLAHSDHAQVPANIVRLNFTTIADTYGAIAPRGVFVEGSPQQQGFLIARQNCLRCHNQGQHGGTKAGRTWAALSTWATEQPSYFQNYIHNPKSFEAKAKMPGNPEYDQPTLQALTAYFQTFTEGTKKATY